MRFNQVEVRKWGTGNGEVITTYPHPNIRLIWTKGTAGLTSVEAQALHRDQLGSVRAVTTFKPLASGAAVSTLRREAATYKPFGEQTEVLQPTQVNQEQKGWIGERYDADAGLQFLNARYYDPELGFFLQPDWFEVTAPGVGTNRYSYSFNDPVNKIDPGGNQIGDALSAIGDFFSGLFGGGGSQSSSETTTETRRPPPNSNVIAGRAVATPGHPSDFDPWGGGAGWELMYGPQAVGTMSPTTVDQLGIIAAAGTVMSSLPSAAEAAVTGAAASAGTRTFYRAVTSAEAKQIAETGVLMPGRNSLEGKWMAEKLKDAIEWGTRMNGAGASTIAEISVPLSRYDSIVNAGLYSAHLDGIGPALYVPFENLSGLAVRLMGK